MKLPNLDHGFHSVVWCASPVSRVRSWPIEDVPFGRRSLLSQPRSGCAPSAGQDRPLLYPGLLCGGEAGTRRPCSGRDHGWARLFARAGDGMDAEVEATQERLPDARQAPSGVAFLFGCLSLWLSFSLLRASCPAPCGPALLFARASCVRVATQGGSNWAAEGRRKLFAPGPYSRAKASRLKSLPQTKVSRQGALLQGIRRCDDGESRGHEKVRRSPAGPSIHAARISPSSPWSATGRAS